MIVVRVLSLILVLVQSRVLKSSVDRCRLSVKTSEQKCPLRARCVWHGCLKPHRFDDDDNTMTHGYVNPIGYLIASQTSPDDPVNLDFGITEGLVNNRAYTVDLLKGQTGDGSIQDKCKQTEDFKVVHTNVFEARSKEPHGYIPGT